MDYDWLLGPTSPSHAATRHRRHQPGCGWAGRRHRDAEAREFAFLWRSHRKQAEVSVQARLAEPAAVIWGLWQNLLQKLHMQAVDGQLMS